MEKFAIKRADFITSVVLGSDMPEPLDMEIAMVGRSNVGKSTLINSLCNNRKLARTSSTPGKTRQINFFRINNEFYLVDLPGYGFAKAPKTEKERWGALMESYLSSHRVSHIFLLLDIRHPPTAEDKMMFNWILHYAVPFTLVATKADKITKSNRKTAANTVAKALGAPPFAMPYSSESALGREELLERIGSIHNDYCPSADE